MKKLSKLNINPEKIMKSHELITLRGGYGGGVECGLVCDATKTCSQTSGCPNCMEPIGWPGSKYCFSA